jgi:hypothetical protein
MTMREKIARLLEPSAWAESILVMPLLFGAATFEPVRGRFDHLRVAALARADEILAVIREPTEAMLEAVETSSEYRFEVSCGHENAGIPGETCTEIFQAMIDAARI